MRNKLFVAQELRSVPNLLFYREGCAAHALHRSVVSSLVENDIVGDVHAVIVSCCVMSHQAALQRALHMLVSEARGAQWV